MVEHSQGKRGLGKVAATLRVPSFQGSALERTAFEAPPRVCNAFTTQEAGASRALRPQAELGDERLRLSAFDYSALRVRKNKRK